MTSAPAIVNLPRPKGLLKAFFNLPILAHRVGMGQLLPPMFLVLTVPGRKSGKLYHTALECRNMGDSLWVISGWGEQTHWYKNVREARIVTIQHRGQTYAARAAFIDDPDSRVRVVERFRRGMGNEMFDQSYGRLFGVDPESSTETRRQVYEQIRPIRFDRLRNQPPPYAGLSPDLLWVWPVVAAAFVIGWVVSQRKAAK